VFETQGTERPFSKLRCGSRNVWTVSVSRNNRDMLDEVVPARKVH